MRGGSWEMDPERVRSAMRSGVVTGFRDNDVGFRVARTLSRSESITP
ncbi:MAG: hypothetical protein K0R41_2470 [Geminicoccaceae bacterium]|nr:hypothetical protein [Geminicoccaceae bacterium]MCE3248645.1 hypothetical protein [Geminicoccaceae bacterium]